MVTVPATSPENYFFDDEGNRKAGIVQGAELDETTMKVYLVLYGGERVDVDHLVENSHHSLGRLHVRGD